MSGVDAVDDGDDRGLEVFDVKRCPSSTLGTHICFPVSVVIKWPRS